MTDFVTPDGGHGIPRASRPFESPMTLAVRNRAVTVAPDTSLVAAGADEAEADTAQRVAADPSVIDAERHSSYSNGVEHVHTLDGLSGGHKSCSTSSTPPAELVAVQCLIHGGWRDPRSTCPACEREGRLSRWQEQR